MRSARLALVELSRRVALRSAGGLEARTRTPSPGAEILKAHLFEQQRRVLEDDAPYSALLCSRRSGKSITLATTLSHVAMAYDGCEAVAYAPTLKMAKRNLYNPLRAICRKYGIRAHFNAQDMEVTWPNGSITYLLGADRIDDIDKARGLAVHIALVDEAQRFKDHILEELIDEVLTPALEDYEGSLVLAGTPKPLCAGYFYNATENPNTAWKVHRWTVADNIYFPRYLKMRDTDPKYAGWSIRDIANARLEELLRRKGWTRETPKVRREWLGEWARDETSFIYPYKRERNFAAALPEGHDFKYGLGIDLGMNALVVMAWANTCNEVFAVKAKKTRFTTIDALAEDIRQMKNEYGVVRMEADCAALGKYIVDEIRRRHGFSLHAADKREKATAQEAVRNDLVAGFVKALPDAQALVDEWAILQYDEDGQEPAKSDNHCSDAWLYIHRWARHYSAKPKRPEDTRTSDEKEEARIEAAMWSRVGKNRTDTSTVGQLKGML